MNLQKMDPVHKGLIFISIGIVLILYSMGIFSKALNGIVILGALFLILYGFIIGDFWSKIQAITHKNKK